MGLLTVRHWPGNQPGADPHRCVLALPGAGYPTSMPGIHVPLRALALAGWTVLDAQWDMRDAEADEQLSVIDEALHELDVLSSAAAHRLVLAKSIGTLAAAWAADHEIPAVWITPLLSRYSIEDDVARSPAPALLAAGAQDTAWDQQAALRTGKTVLELGRADHGLQTGDWREELEVLHTLTEGGEAFAAALL